MRPAAVDLFCGGGGASKGLQDAGYAVTGVDIAPQRHYPYPIIITDALTLDPEWLGSFALVWASPPCQRFGKTARQHGTDTSWPDLVGDTRTLLGLAGVPSVMENLTAAPLRQDLMLCGGMFGLRLARHRTFEIHGFQVTQPRHRDHAPDVVTVTGHTGGVSTRDGTQLRGTIQDWRDAMGIHWLPSRKLSQAVPLAFSHHIARAARKQS
jgi:DNA (cytosine-5)-methyltransferase 1